MNRRQAIFLTLASSLAAGTNIVTPHTLLATTSKSQEKRQQLSSINVMIPPGPVPQGKGQTAIRFEHQLTNATLDFLFTWYGKGNVPVWRKKIDQVPFQKRIPLITHYVLQSVEKHHSVYPVDPIWIMAQIMTESFFCEKAVSTSLAVGICQFITPTAREYNLLCATDKPAHFKAPYKKTELAGEEKKFLEARAKLKALRKKHSDLFSRPLEIVKQLLTEKQTQKQKEKMRDYAHILEQTARLQKQIVIHRKNYQAYLQANTADKNILTAEDLAALNAFDQRMTLQQPVDAMVLMMARHLQQRNGNIIAATAGYNAGLKTTEVTHGAAKPYGRLPVIQETVDYVSRIFVRHHELVKRMGK